MPFVRAVTKVCAKPKINASKPVTDGCMKSLAFIKYLKISSPIQLANRSNLFLKNRAHFPFIFYLLTLVN